MSPGGFRDRDDAIAALRSYAALLRAAGEDAPPLPDPRLRALEALVSRGGARPPAAPPVPDFPDRDPGSGFSLTAPSTPPPRAEGRAAAPLTELPRPEYRDLATMERAISGCLKCPLGRTRTKFVFGEGNPEAAILLVGEAPGESEDLSGRPFVGRAGRLLDQLLSEVGLARAEVFIANVLKCRPPGNRAPQPEEVACCEPYLFQQIALLAPRAIVCLGAPAAQTLLRTRKAIGELRGKLARFAGIPVVPTYHPAFLLRPTGRPMIATVRQDMRLAIAQAAQAA